MNKVFFKAGLVKIHQSCYHSIFGTASHTRRPKYWKHGTQCLLIQGLKIVGNKPQSVLEQFLLTTLKANNF